VLIIATLILHYSEIFRGQNPLYVILKMIGWFLFFVSIIWSLVNTIIILKKKNSLQTKISWSLVSVIPFAYIISTFLGFYIKF